MIVLIIVIIFAASFVLFLGTQRKGSQLTTSQTHTTRWQNFFTRLSIVPQRFPLALLAALALFSIGVYIIANETFQDMELFGRYIVALIALLWLGTAVELWHEASGRSEKSRWYARIGVGIFIVGYWLLLPHIFGDHLYGMFFVKHILWHICFFLTILFAPFLFTRYAPKNTTFYQHANFIIMHVILAFLFSVIAFALGALFLASLNLLFDAEIEKGFQYWWLFCATIIGPLFFLTSVNQQQGSMECSAVCPRNTRILTHFIVIPFVALYFIVLYVYTGKIVLSWEWPEGAVSWLVLAFSAIGWLSYVGIFPWRDQSKVFSFFTKFFPFVALPQVIVLFIALWWRVDAYGITVNRYFLAAAGVWLAFAACYIMFTRHKKIIVLPLSLFVVLFAISIGPWGVAQVSERSQAQRLQMLITQHELLDAQGAPQKVVGQNLSTQEQNDIASIIRYLSRTHGAQSLERALPSIVPDVYDDDNTTIEDYRKCTQRACSTWEMTSRVQDALGVQESYRYATDPPTQEEDQFRFDVRDVAREENRDVVSVRGYDYYVRDIYSYPYAKRITLPQFDDVDDARYAVQTEDSHRQEFNILRSGEVVDTFSLVTVAQVIMDRDHELERNDFRVPLEGAFVDVVVDVERFEGIKKEDEVTSLENFRFDLFIHVKDNQERE